LSFDSLTQCEQLKPGPLTSYSPHDVRPCPTAEQSVQSERNRKCQRAEILTSTPVKKIQRKKSKERVCKPDRMQERSFSEVRSTKKTKSVSKPRYFCQVYEYPYSEPPKEDWTQCSQCSLCSHESCTSYSSRGSHVCDECFD
jgi:hypothetical protein